MPLLTLILVSAVMLMLSGFVESMVYDSFPEFPLKPFTVAGTYALGVYGLYVIYISVKARNPKARIGMLLCGFLAILIAQCCLEFMLKFE